MPLKEPSAGDEELASVKHLSAKQRRFVCTCTVTSLCRCHYCVETFVSMDQSQHLLKVPVALLDLKALSNQHSNMPCPHRQSEVKRSDVQHN